MKRNKKNGFSLMELLVVIAITVIAMTIAFQVFTALHKNYKILISYLGSYLKGREAIDFISKDCRIAIRVMDNYAGCATANDCLVLKVPSIDASRNIIDINNEFDYIIYRMDDEDLWKTVILGDKSSRQAYDGVLKQSIESLYFASKGMPLSDIEHKSSVTHLTLRVSIAGSVLGKEYKVMPGTTVKLMNYEWEFVR